MNTVSDKNVVHFQQYITYGDIHIECW